MDTEEIFADMGKFWTLRVSLLPLYVSKRWSDIEQDALNLIQH